MRSDGRTLLLRQAIQARFPRRPVLAFGHRQNAGPLGIAQVREQRRIKLVPLLQTQLVQTDIGDLQVRVDRLSVGQLFLYDPHDHLGRDAQTTSYFFLIAADERL